MKIIGCVQARLGSTRLPRKILEPLAGKPMLQMLLERLGHSHYLDNLVVAMPYADLHETVGHVVWTDVPRVVEWRSYKVPDDDLVARHAAVAREFDADLIVRVPSDNPFVDPWFVDQAIALNDKSGGGRLTTTLQMATFGGLLDGLGAEVYPRALLESLDAMPAYANAAEWRAGVPDPREHPMAFATSRGITLESAVDTDWRHGPMRFDVDWPADLDRMRRIAAWVVERHGPHFSARNLNSCPHEVLA